MPRISLALLLLLLAAACASTGPAAEGESSSDFSVRITQTNEPVLIAVDQPANFVYRIDVTNNTSVPVKLEWVQLRTTGGGPYTFGSQSRSYDKTIGPGQTGSVDFWATARITDYTRGGTLPVNLRATLTTSAEGQKDRTSSYSVQVPSQFQLGVGTR